MASQAEYDCLSNPNFAVICSFMDRYGVTLGLPEIGYKDLQEWIEDAKKVHPLLIDLHVRLLRRIHKKLSNVTADRWERGVVKFCYKYSNVDAWEIERFGYKLAKISTKLKLLKNLMESQFDCNNKFKDKVNEIPIEEMRFQPVGRDKDGMAYWYLLDKELNLRIYREHQDDVDSESWELVCRNRDDLAKLITGLETGTGMKLDKQESSDQSEPVSDFNEDSMESFKQKTPLGPSPLTIKQEPGDSDTLDSKQQIVLKISKSDIQSPSKMLKDKFVKEKGSEIQRIMCKMKEEGLVDSENENDKDDISKKDEVDGLIDSKEGCEESVAEKSYKHIVKCKSVQDNINESDSKSDVKEENSEVIDNIKGKSECVNSSEKEVNGSQASEKVKDDIKSEEMEAKSELERKAVKEEKHSDTDEDKTGDDRKCRSDKIVSKQNETEICNEIIQDNLQNKDQKNANCETVPEKSKEFKEMDPELKKSTTDCKSETEKENIEIPQKDSLSEAANLAVESKSESQSNKRDIPEKGGIVSTENVTDIKNENLSKLTDKVSKSEQNTADILVENKNNESAINDRENEAKEIEKSEFTNVIQDTDDKKITGAIDTNELNKESLTLQSNEKSKGTELSDSSEKCQTETIEQKKEHSEEKQRLISDDDIKVKSSEDYEEIKDSDNHIEYKKEKSTEENAVKDNSTDDIRKDPETEDSKNDPESSLKLCEGDTEGSGSEKDAKSNVTEKLKHEKSFKDKTPEKCDVVKKARKRKNDEIKTESGSSSTEDEVDIESKQPCKRPIKEAVRKSPIKEPDETEVVKEAETNNIEDRNVSDKLGEEDKHDSDSNEVKKEGNKSKQDSELKSESNEVTGSNNVVSVDEKTCLKNESEVIKQQKTIGESEENVSKPEEKFEEEVMNKKEKSDCETVQKDKQKIMDENEKDSTALDEIVEEKLMNRSFKNSSDLDEKVESENETGGRQQRKVKGLVAHSKRSKSKAQKRQAENSDDMEPAEPASKRSKLRGRVSSRGRGKRRGVNFDSSSSDDDLPLSQVVGRGRGSNSKGRGRQAVGRQQTKATKEPAKKKKVDKEESKASILEIPDIPSDLSEEDTGRRRSARVRNLRARKKSPSPDYVPSELDVSDDDFFEDDDDVDFKLKSKKIKKREPKEVIEEIPKGRNALRHEAKANKKEAKVIEEEEEGEAACVKCLKSHQPEWILLCDKCDAGYHTACLRPPLMIIPDGDWFCPPCEHTSLKEKLEENLKSLDQAILKNDRMVRRQERLAFVSVSLDNVLKEPEPGDIKKDRSRKKPNYRESDVETESQSSNESGSSSSTSESEGSSEEITHHKKQKFVQRACRSKKSVSYRFEEFDELIMDAIEEDLSIPKEPKPRKVKPPGISRGKDMSNILGVSDEEEKPKKPIRKRKPRLTELDEEIDDDDTDDYQLSDATNASDATKSSNYESEDVSEDSIESSWRLNTRSTRKSRRKGGRNRRYKDDFVVDSDFESEEDNKRRSKRRPRKTKINYREINSDETEVEDNDDSFHSSELSDSDFEDKRRKRNDKKKKAEIKERPRSGKRQRIRKVLSSSESSEEDSDESGPRKKKGKKPPSKTARYDSDETDEGSEKIKTKKSKGKKFQKLSDKSESETEESEETDSSETEVSDSDSNMNKKKQKYKMVKKVIKSDSEEDEEGDEKRDDSQDTEKESEGSGWEEIGVDTDDNVTDSKVVLENGSEKGEQIDKSKTDMITTDESSKTDIGKQEQGIELKNQKENSKNNFDESQMESDVAEKMEDTYKVADSEKDSSTTEVTPQKKKRGRKPKNETVNEDSTTPEITPKKRGRKPKAKPEASEANVDETPIKKKRGRKSKAEKDAEVAGNIVGHVDDQMKANNGEIEEKKTTNVSEIKKEVTDVTVDIKAPIEQSVDDKNTTEISQMNEKGKDDSPLSVRNKQNAPVGVVKPEVRQGVIVENKQVTDGRLQENRAGETSVNPLQGMRDLAMGNQNAQGQHQSSFTPYTQSNYQAQNMQGYIGQPGFQGYQHQTPPYGQSVPGSHHPHQAGPQGIPRGPPPQYPPNQGPMSPNSYQQHGSYMGPMQQGQGFYPGNYRPAGGQGEGFGSPNPHGANPQYYHPHQGQYQGQRHGYPDYPGPYHMGPQGLVPIPPNQQGPGPYPGMPYNYPNMPQGMHRPGFGPPCPQQSMSPNQQVRPQTRLPGPLPPLQQSSPTPRVENDAPNRGFMMDNILKPSPEGAPNDVEDSAEVSDIDRYTSFLCKSTD